MCPPMIIYPEFPNPSSRIDISGFKSSNTFLQISINVVYIIKYHSTNQFIFLCIVKRIIYFPIKVTYFHF